MKISSSILFIALFTAFQSCGSAAVISDSDQIETDQVMVSTPSDVGEQITITGSFRSVAGIMDKMSCYTSNGGYVTLANGSTVAVSFNENENVENCDKITVTGYMINRSIEGGGPCPAGEMSYMKVQSYVVGKTPPPAVVKQETITGSFRSVAGIMDNLSCYTSNGGYVKLANGSTVAVSFNDYENVETCDKITVTGYMTSRSIEGGGPCPAGEMGFLKVQSYVIGETDY